MDAQHGLFGVFATSLTQHAASVYRISTQLSWPTTSSSLSSSSSSSSSKDKVNQSTVEAHVNQSCLSYTPLSAECWDV